MFWNSFFFPRSGPPCGRHTCPVAGLADTQRRNSAGKGVGVRLDARKGTGPLLRSRIGRDKAIRQQIGCMRAVCHWATAMGTLLLAKVQGLPDGRQEMRALDSAVASDALERPYTVGGGGVPPLTPPASLPLDPPPPPPLVMFEADSQYFASAPSVPRGLKLQKPSAGTVGGP